MLDVSIAEVAVVPSFVLDSLVVVLSTDELVRTLAVIVLEAPGEE